MKLGPLLKTSSELKIYKVPLPETDHTGMLLPEMEHSRETFSPLTTCIDLFWDKKILCVCWDGVPIVSRASLLTRDFLSTLFVVMHL